MDDALIARWKQGEPAATTAVRNALRTVAERVLSNPALRHAEGTGGRRLVEDEERRREITATVAKEVMSRGGDSAATLNAMALMTASRHAVEAVRQGRPLAGSAHLPPPIAVAMALTPEALPQAQREAMSRHVEGCSSCSDDCRLVREVVRSAATSTKDSSTTEIEEAVHESASSAMDEAFNAAAAEVDAAESRTTAPATGTLPPRRPTQTRPNAARAAARPAPTETRGFTVDWRGLLVLVALAGVGYAWWRSEHHAQALKEINPAIAALADRSPPRLNDNEVVPKYAEDAVALLKKGDCRTAAARFRTARRSHPEDRRLWVLEGGSFVCAGDGDAARQSLDVITRDTDVTPVALWFQAQALLLTGSVGQAQDALEKVASSKSPYADKAKAQLGKVNALTD